MKQFQYLILIAILFYLIGFFSAHLYSISSDKEKEKIVEKISNSNSKIELNKNRIRR